MPELAIEKHSPSPDASLALVREAMDKGYTGEQLQGFLDFATRYRQEQAKAAYFVAFKSFKDNLPRLKKNKHVQYPNRDASKPETSYWHITLDSACTTLIPALGKVGITHRWTSDVSQAGVTVTCYLRHEMGYEEKGASLTGPVDTSGGKNAIQGVGSSNTHLQRYTLLASCGVTVEGLDNDGADPEVKSEDRLDEGIALEWLDSIHQAPSGAELKRVFQNALKAAANDLNAAKQFSEAKNAAYKKLAKDGAL